MFFLLFISGTLILRCKPSKNKIGGTPLLSMKKLLSFSIICFLSINAFAQSGTMLPDGFIVPNLADAPACTADDKGKIYFNTTTKLMMVCNGSQWKPTMSQWKDNQALPGTINYYGKVGINTETPEYDLDVNGKGRVSEGLYITKSLGIGMSNPSLSLEIVDGDIGLTSTTDTKTWKLDYSDDDNHLAIKEDGMARMVLANGGNVGIGTVAPTEKLSVVGAGSFSGNLTVNGGKGIIRSATEASMKVLMTQVYLGASFSVLAGNCSNSTTINIGTANFSAAPTVQVGNLVSGTGNFGKLVVSVQSATSTGVIVRLCNNTTSSISLSNTVFNLLCIGQ